MAKPRVSSSTAPRGQADEQTLKTLAELVSLGGGKAQRARVEAIKARQFYEHGLRADTFERSRRFYVELMRHLA